MFPGTRTHFYVGLVQLEPGDTVPFLWHTLPNRPAENEVVVTARCTTPTEPRRPIKAWKPLDLPVPKRQATDDGLTIRAKVTRDGDWLTVDGRLLNNTGNPRQLFVLPDGDRVFLCGLVQLLDIAGKRFGADIKWRQPSGVWVRKEIDNSGLSFRF